MIIIADAHISRSKGSDVPFFEMLAALEANNHPLIFIGDLFELWIALPGFEENIHKQFLDWCSEQKKYRTIGFIEGNHEFFVSQEKGEYFSWSGELFSKDEKGCYFCHGDMINRQDIRYRRFRRISKSRMAKHILRNLPFGPVFARRVKQTLKTPDKIYHNGLPCAEIKAFAESIFANGVKSVFTGHFHRQCQYQGVKGGILRILPAWCDNEMITLYDKERDQAVYSNWRDL